METLPALHLLETDPVSETWALENTQDDDERRE
jgi:hypothetical protein